ncbi:MAG: hypothetical protein L6Q57_03655 [Alphaproteobacteria bacterium]|nr:hypothetical protein [Alphaproteobacteria bacterium]
MTQHHASDERNTILYLYGFFGLAVLSSVIPHTLAAVISIVLILLILPLAYHLRRKADAESLLANHATFIICTIWVGSFVAVAGLLAGSTVLLLYIDHNPLYPCLSGIMDGHPVPMDGPGLHALFSPCLGDYLSKNGTIFAISGLLAIVPPLAYVGVRYVRGLSRAAKGHRLAHPQAWI